MKHAITHSLLPVTRYGRLSALGRVFSSPSLCDLLETALGNRDVEHATWNVSYGRAQRASGKRGDLFSG
jgi:hypothetical protein